MEFPTSIVPRSQPIPFGISYDADQAIDALENQEYQVRHGLTAAALGSIVMMARQKHIVEQCPQDQSVARFDSPESGEKWLATRGGRAVYLLMKHTEVGQRLAGYGWTGPSYNEDAPQHDNTFEIRIGEEARSNMLAASFAQLIIDSSCKLYSANKFWLETWETQPKAVAMYEAIGFRHRIIAPGFKQVKNKPRFEGRMVMTLDKVV